MDPVKTLIDAGSSQHFINLDFVKRHKLETIPLQKPQKVEGIDGKDVKSLITLKVTLNITIEGKTFKQHFYVMPLGNTKAILGLLWLQEANPEISWTDMTLQYWEHVLKGKASGSHSKLPPEFKQYKSVFDAELFKKLPEHREYDCEIDFKEDAILPRPAKVFPISDGH